MKRIPRVKPYNLKQTFCYIGMVAIHFWILNCEKFCQSPISIWIRVSLGCFSFYLMTCIVCFHSEWYIKLEFLIKASRIFLFIFVPIWFTIGGFFIHYDRDCSEQWPSAFWFILIANASLLICAVYFLILISLLLIPELLQQQSSKT